MLVKLEIMHSGQIVVLWNFSGSTSVQLNRKSVPDKFRFNWTKVEPKCSILLLFEMLRSPTVWPDCMISRLTRASPINYNVSVILKIWQQWQLKNNFAGPGHSESLAETETSAQGSSGGCSRESTSMASPWIRMIFFPTPCRIGDRL